MDKNIGKNRSKSLSGKYSQKSFYHAKQSATDALITASKKSNSETSETTGDLIGNKIDDKILKFHNIYNKIIQRQLQVRIIKKYLQKNKKKKKLLMI